MYSKLRLQHAVLLGFGLKMAKMALNIVKVGMHTYFPNADLNLWLNFNFEKLVKREASLCGFTKVGIKEGENVGMSQKFTCTLVHQVDIQIYIGFR